MKLVFIHGAGCDGTIFSAQTAAFANSVAVNLPGHSRDGYADTIADFADDVSAQLQQFGFDDVIVAGSSMGGAIALELALRKHPAVRAIALLGSGMRLRVSPAIFNAIDADFDAATPAFAGYFFHEHRPEWIETTASLMRSIGAKQTKADFTACNAFDVADRVGEIRIPLLALTGEKDVMTPAKFATSLADRIPGAEARIVPDAGHLLFIERPAETNEALRAFVSQIV